MESAAAGGGEPNKELIPKVTNSSVASGGPRLPIPNISIWAKWALGSIVCLALPFYKKILKIEAHHAQRVLPADNDGVEKAAETVVEAIEKVAEVAEKVATDIADALPANSHIKEEVMDAEHFAEEVEKDAEKAEEFIHKVDKIKDEIEETVEPIIEEGETSGKETQYEEKNKEPGSSSDL